MEKTCVRAESGAVCGGGPHLRGCGASYRGCHLQISRGVCGLAHPALAEKAEPFPTRIRINQYPQGAGNASLSWQLPTPSADAIWICVDTSAESPPEAQFLSRRDPEMEACGLGPSLPVCSPLVQVTRKKNSGGTGHAPLWRRVKIRRQCPRAGEAPAIAEGNSVTRSPRHGGRSPMVLAPETDFNSRGRNRHDVGREPSDHYAHSATEHVDGKTH